MKLFDEMPVLECDRILLKEMEDRDASALREMTESLVVYKYLPTFLFEKKYEDPREVIRRLRPECFDTQESLILGIYRKDGRKFCGLGEFYGFKDAIHKTCIGYRLKEDCWGQGIATEAVALMVDYLYSKTDTEIITASTMVENRASAHVLEKNGFTMSAAAVPEDWGFDQPTIADKWFR